MKKKKLIIHIVLGLLILLIPLMLTSEGGLYITSDFQIIGVNYFIRAGALIVSILVMYVGINNYFKLDESK